MDLFKKSANEFFESIHMALSSLSANKMRAILTMLGIIFGVAAVITMVGLGNGAQKAVLDRLQTLGSNLLFIRPGSQEFHGVHGGFGSRMTLKDHDLEALKERSYLFAYVVPEFSRNCQLEYETKNWNCSVTGTTPEFEIARNFHAVEGRYFNADEVEKSERVAVIGTEVRKNLFEDADPVGKTIKVNSENFLVVGSLEKKGQTGWHNEDDQIFIPITTAQKRLFGADYLTGISIKVVNENLMDDAFLEVEKILRRQHRLRRDQDNDFNIRNQSDIIQTFQESNKAFGFLLAAIAGVSLLVGGIGIMNIMLVTVTERTREIGIRKAIGARKRDILLQFLIESIALSISGGIIGIFVGIFLSYALSSWADWNTMVSVSSIFLSFSFAVMVGLFFGMYPAQKAAALHPIVALRYE
jgi:putative ABC transport system permease protein